MGRAGKMATLLRLGRTKLRVLHVVPVGDCARSVVVRAVPPGRWASLPRGEVKRVAASPVPG